MSAKSNAQEMKFPRRTHSATNLTDREVTIGIRVLQKLVTSEKPVGSDWTNPISAINEVVTALETYQSGLEVENVKRAEHEAKIAAAIEAASSEETTEPAEE